MPIVDLITTNTGSFSAGNWTPQPGTYNNGPDYVAALAAEGSGSYIYNLAGFNSDVHIQTDASPIPTGSTINSVTLVCDVYGIGPPFSPPAPYIDGLGLLAAPGNFNTGQVVVGGSYAEVTALYPHALTLAQLANSIMELGADNTAGQIYCDYMALRVDYTPPPPPGRIATWVAPAWPPTCGVPPLRRFKPFEMIDRGATSPEEVTALYAAKFGQPPSGYYLWVVWRSMDHGFWPNEQSPIEGYIVP